MEKNYSLIMNSGLSGTGHQARRQISSSVRILPASILVLLFLVSAGCLQAGTTTGPEPSVPTATDTPLSPDLQVQATTEEVTDEKAVAATAERPDGTMVVITYHGGPDSDQLMELAITVTDSKGTVRIQTMGSRLGTTPVQNGATATIYGTFDVEARVIATGYFSDGTHQDLIDTRL
jgi:hypothetical protein